MQPGLDRDAVRDDVRDYVVEHLADPDGVLIADETGFAKKGRASTCAWRHDGWAGRPPRG